VSGAEFDDTDHSHSPFVSSKKAMAAMRTLAAEHGLAFTFNPGGGEFYKSGFRCQISTYDDIEDLAKLRRALNESKRK
jgi:hypothetical protein